MKKIRILKNVLHHTRADKILISYLLFVLIDALVIWIADPGIDSYGNSLWYCCATISTAGYGDEVAVTFISKIATVLLMIYSIIVIAIITGVIVNFYNQLISIRQKDTLEAFVHKLEHLSELSKEELEELSEHVKRFAKNRKEEQND